eukprot:352919-Chlamydomonas_euryale.AAC.1
MTQPGKGHCRPALARTKQLAGGGVILLHQLSAVCRMFQGRTGQRRVAEPMHAARFKVTEPPYAPSKVVWTFRRPPCTIAVVLPP